MINYRLINRNIVGKLKANEMYTYFCLLAKSDFNTGISYIKQDNLCKITQIKKLDTLQAHLKKFYKDSLVYKKEQGHFGDKGYFKTNTYYIPIPSDNWIRVNIDLITKDNIPPNLKGFLLLLMCLTLNNTNFIGYNRTQITRLINMDAKTVRSYFKLAIENGWVIENDKGFEIMKNSFMIDEKIPKDFLDEHYKIYTDNYIIVKDFLLKKQHVSS